MRYCATCGHPESDHPYRHPFVSRQPAPEPEAEDLELDLEDVALDTRAMALNAAAELDAMRDQLAADLPDSPGLSYALGCLQDASRALGGVK